MHSVQLFLSATSEEESARTSIILASVEKTVKTAIILATTKGFYVFLLFSIILELANQLRVIIRHFSVMVPPSSESQRTTVVVSARYFMTLPSSDWIGTNAVSLIGVQNQQLLGISTIMELINY